jgi:hypothetical protein
MKLIDLLTGFANGENPPKKIKIGCFEDIFVFIGDDYRTEYEDDLFRDYDILQMLNDEIIIVEK